MMKLTWILSMMITAMPAVADEKKCVVVQMQGSVAVPHRTLIGAESMSTGIFNAIGISMKWKEVRNRKTDSACANIRVEFLATAPPTLLSGALGYATPYQLNGTRVVIFIDRVLRGQRTGTKAEADLAFVMAHEVGHILQGVSRHSDAGIMKSHSPTTNILATELRFSREDASLIHAGLRRLLETVADAR
jgi:fructose-specific component phosphotransferase system IIB-like protein